MITAILPEADTAHKRLIVFASDLSQLANDRLDLELRGLVDDLHADLLRSANEED